MGGSHTHTLQKKKMALMNSVKNTFEVPAAFAAYFLKGFVLYQIRPAGFHPVFVTADSAYSKGKADQFV